MAAAAGALPPPKARADEPEAITFECFFPPHKSGRRSSAWLLEPSRRVSPRRSLRAWFSAHLAGCQRCNAEGADPIASVDDRLPHRNCFIVAVLHVLAFGYAPPVFAQPKGAKPGDYDGTTQERTFIWEETKRRIADGRLRWLRRGEPAPLAVAPRFVVSRRVATQEARRRFDEIRRRLWGGSEEAAHVSAAATPSGEGATDERAERCAATGAGRVGRLPRHEFLVRRDDQPEADRASRADPSGNDPPSWPRPAPLFTSKLRMVVDLRQVNERLLKPAYHYATVRDLVCQLRPGWRCGTIDLAAGYTQLALHPRAHAICGFAVKPPGRRVRSARAKRGLYTRLPMGLATAPAIFSAVTATALAAIRSTGVMASSVYLDDFGVAGPPESADRDFGVALRTLDVLGLSVSPSKVVPPRAAFTYLGVVVSSVAGARRAEISVAIPDGKRDLMAAELADLLRAAGGSSVATLGQLQSAVGRLSWAAAVVPAGQPRTAVLARVAAAVRGEALERGVSQRKRLERTPVPGWSAAAVDALRWWLRRLTGAPLVAPVLGPDAPVVVIRSDASGTIGGAGAADGDRAWSWLRWSSAARARSTTFLELLPIAAVVCAADRDFSLWRGHVVVALVDNAGAAACINGGKAAGDGGRSAALVAAMLDAAERHEFTLAAAWWPREFNDLPDRLSKSRSLAAARDAARSADGRDVRNAAPFVPAEWRAWLAHPDCGDGSSASRDRSPAASGERGDHGGDTASVPADGSGAAAARSDTARSGGQRRLT